VIPVELPTFPFIRVGLNPGVRKQTLQIVLQITVGIMQQVAVQAPDRTGHLQAVVWVTPAPGRVRLADKPQPPFGVPGMPNPVAEVKITSIQQEPIDRRFAVREGGANRCRQLGRQDLVGVETQHPWLLAPFERDVLLRHMPLPRLDGEQRTKLARDLRGPVLRAGVDNNDFRGQRLYACQALRQIGFFVQRNDRYRQG